MSLLISNEYQLKAHLSNARAHDFITKIKKRNPYYATNANICVKWLKNSFIKFKTRLL